MKFVGCICLPVLTDGLLFWLEEQLVKGSSVAPLPNRHPPLRFLFLCAKHFVFSVVVVQVYALHINSFHGLALGNYYLFKR